MPEESDVEKQRQANIAERDALLRKLALENQTVGIFPKPNRGSSGDPHGAPKKKRAPVKKVKAEENIQPRRTSSRLAGIQADSEVAKRKAEEEYERAKEEARLKKLRRPDDLALGDIVVNGTLRGTGLLGSDLFFGPRRHERTFGENEVKQTTDKELRALREKMSSLELWDGWEPNRIKLTPERIYTMSFHPTTSKPLVFAGDKMGHLGIIDASQKGSASSGRQEVVKSEAETTQTLPIHTKDPEKGPAGKQDADDGESEDDDDADPMITTIKPHTRTITAMHIHHAKPHTLYTSSYDSSIRAVDLQKAMAVEIYGPADLGDDEPISGIDMAAAEPNVVFFTTLNGALGRHDIREDSRSTELYQLSEKKIGGFSLNPIAPHYLATASLDRFMRLWDLRKITKKLPTLVGEHESRLSVSHASFNSAGQVATSSYDDTIKIHSFGVGTANAKRSGALESMGHWKSGFQLDEEAMKPQVVVRHNNQTGRWVTM